MKRFVILGLLASVGHASAAFAGESLLTSGGRQIQQMVTAPSAPASNAVLNAVPGLPRTGAAQPSYQTEGPGNLSKSGHSKMTKVLIYSAIGAGFAISAWQIDKHVLNLTPSSLGQRKD